MMFYWVYNTINKTNAIYQIENDTALCSVDGFQICPSSLLKPMGPFEFKDFYIAFNEILNNASPIYKVIAISDTLITEDTHPELYV